jgi:fatty-acyl-CoA synthase
VAAQSSDDPGIEPDVTSRWALIFTSGTSSAPKAVICTQRRMLQTGVRMSAIMDLGPDDIGYVCMPLFHSNALMVGWAPSIAVGASVALARKFSASSWLADVRRYGATYFNYTGKPLSYLVATPEQPDDADNPLRVAFGNEGSPEVIDTFGRRFGVEVIDAFGATEGGIAVNRDEGVKPGSVGKTGDTVKVVDPEGNELPVARISPDGSLLNADECVGEIVNTAGAGPFEGYYNNAEATESTLRGGWYWSGDLGYVDDEGFLFFAGRTADWLRVDGENFPAGPIEDAIGHHPDVVLAAVYGVPDEHAGDQVMAAVRLREGATFDAAAFARYIDALPEVGPKWRPRYVRVVGEFPTTGTNKIVKRTLVRQKYRRDLCGDDLLYVRDRGADDYRAFTADDEAALRAALEHAGRIRFWEL